MAKHSFPETLKRLVAQDADKTAFICGDRSISRAELHRVSNQMARVYLEQGVTTDDLVTIGLPNSIEWCIACMAAWKVGAIPNPVSPELPARERLTIIKRANPALVIGVAEDVAGFCCLPRGFKPEKDVAADDLPDCVSKHDRALTSGGSTGVPKLILPNNPAEFEPGSPYNFFGAEQTALVPGPLYHAIPFSAAWHSLFNGAKVVVMERFEPAVALALIETHNVDRVAFVPTMLSRIARLPDELRLKRDLSSLKVVISVGAPCPQWVMKFWIDWLGPRVMNETYGSSERIGGSYINGVDWLKHPGSVGKPVGSKIKIVDPETGAECPVGETGEIYMMPLGGSGTTFQYRGSDRRMDGSGWESVGDMGHLDQDGFLYIDDRRTDMIVCRGRNIFPAELEAALEEHPMVRSCVVIGLPDDDLGQRIHAIVESVGSVAEAELKAHMQDRLAHYKIPKSFEFASDPLRNDAGKVRRSALREERIAKVRLQQS